jgi:hypothetical protein
MSTFTALIIFLAVYLHNFSCYYQLINTSFRKERRFGYRASFSCMRHLIPVYTTLNFWYGTDKIGTRTTILVLGLPI